MKQTFIKTDFKTFTIDLEDDQVYTMKSIIEMGLKKYVNEKYGDVSVSTRLKDLARARIGTSHYSYFNDEVDNYMTANYLDHQTINLYFVQQS